MFCLTQKEVSFELLAGKFMQQFMLAHHHDVSDLQNNCPCTRITCSLAESLHRSLEVIFTFQVRTLAVVSSDFVYKLSVVSKVYGNTSLKIGPLYIGFSKKIILRLATK